jgi:acid phosphatase family membrane protein YuiD
MSSRYVLVTPLIGWVAAQGLKYIINLRKDGLQLKDLYSSGGFPSSHTTSTVALATYLGATDGWTSHIFGLATMFSAVVMYDAIGVRRAVGEQSRLLREMAAQKKVNYKVRGMHTALGHSPFEVFGGLILGIVIGLIVSTM